VRTKKLYAGHVAVDIEYTVHDIMASMLLAPAYAPPDENTLLPPTHAAPPYADENTMCASKVYSTNVCSINSQRTQHVANPMLHLSNTASGNLLRQIFAAPAIYLEAVVGEGPYVKRVSYYFALRATPETELQVSTMLLSQKQLLYQNSAELAVKKVR